MKKNSLDKELYHQIGINDLILFGIYSVISSGRKCNFERLTKECFILFPKAFGFPHYSKWPDSRKLDRPLRTLRKRKLITGDPKTSFSLTKIGEKIAKEIVTTSRQRKLKFK